jgi:acetyl esterase/lipase
MHRVRRLLLCALLATAMSPVAVQAAAAKSTTATAAKSTSKAKKTVKKATKKRKGVKAKAAQEKQDPNTGLRGSACKAVYVPGTPDPSLDMTSLGAMGNVYEIGAPAGGSVRRVMMIVHGGGWYRVGQGLLDTERESAAAWQKVGWQTVNTSYRACRHSLDDVLAVYDAVRARVGAGVPICLKGESAGGQLALMVAALRPDVACVIAGAPPTDLWTLKSQGVAAGHGATAAETVGLARAAFGRDRMTEVSPASNAAAIQARLLLANSQDDNLVPAQQQQQLADQVRAARPDAYVDIDLLEAGSSGFIHGTASTEALKDLERRIALLVKPFGAAPSSTPTKKPVKVFPLFSLLFGRG